MIPLTNIKDVVGIQIHGAHSCVAEAVRVKHVCSAICFDIRNNSIDVCRAVEYIK